MSEVTAEMIERGRGADPRLAARRRKVAAKLQDAREKLTSSGSGHRTFDLDLLAQFARTRKAATPAVMGLSIIFATVASTWAPLPLLMIWLVLVCASLLLGYGLAARYLDSMETAAPVTWQRRFVLTEFVDGVVFAAIIAMLMGVQDANARTFVLFILLMMSAMKALMSATVPHAVYAALAPITLAIVSFVHGGADQGAVSLTIMAGVAQVFFVLLSKRFYANAVAALALRTDKDDLIAELEQAKANSDEARRRAEEASLAKSRFLATMSHELRTPLNAILGFSEVMANELFGAHATPSYKDYSRDIHASGEHLLMLINEILDLSRVEAGRYELREEPVSLPGVVEDCAHLLHMRAKKRGIVVKPQIEANLPRIWADERALRQVTLNLLTNAIKFTPQGGTIVVKVGWTGAGGQYVSIKDSGVGIPEDEIPVVMSSFGRGSMALKNADEGSGLGLPIVKGLVEMHGGVFILKSEVRVGTEVIVILPPERVMDALPQLDPPTNADAAQTRRPARASSVQSAA